MHLRGSIFQNFLTKGNGTFLWTLSLRNLGPSMLVPLDTTTLKTSPPPERPLFAPDGVNYLYDYFIVSFLGGSRELMSTQLTAIRARRGTSSSYPVSDQVFIYIWNVDVTDK